MHKDREETTESDQPVLGQAKHGDWQNDVKKSTDGKAKKGGKPTTGEKNALTLAAQNESASKKKKPFEYNEADQMDQPRKPFSLKELDPEQMQEINNLLKEYIEVPRPHSLPKKTLLPSPDMHPSALEDEDLTELQRN